MNANEMPAIGRMADLETQLIDQAMQDSAFRDRLLTNPKSVLSERGLTVPDEVQIQVLQETSSQFYLVLPSLADESGSEAIALSDAELEAVSGGGSNVSSWTGCASGRVGCVLSTPETTPTTPTSSSSSGYTPPNTPNPSY
ncbi:MULTISPECIES: NHLP leader peptide family RiPP precursor [Leptolyngbya]|uniref:NHLP leader peptide family RiPP n=1 Tax=Leptolyngbya boryana CZ1 TaxID=3060204 RepID=A0AA96WR03_LEPBY|nr:MULTISPECIES: NHLP leader peptide family RiPP precursor [Leptolyngbya]MBD1856119.1 NHLP leader peptide family natural product precursor [Leptolyngbya sp. FACHB-1624]MCY6490348.1 NHLP leader peptide family RiPP precursor [Leptolyngbya sp. GGD]WNZ43918.1 NHLP leader peptide family RiPP precursor [Leptolyngbya boryana CZ1]